MIKIKIGILLSLICLFDAAGQIEHLEPPFWWAGMKNPDLQLMVHGENISSASVHLDYEGVELRSVSKLANPNFLFLDLCLSPDVHPGTFDIMFSRDNRTVATCSYELKKREEGSAMREGFNSSDVMYLIMPDRFANGDPANDEFEDMQDKLDREEPYGRHGGDIQGIIDHLDYIDTMGFTAIWLNPVLENDQKEGSYHGYAATDFYRVDRRFGSNEDYRKLSELAREKGIKMIMDMIFNHCGSEHWWMEDMPSPDWINGWPDYFITSHLRTVNQDPHASERDKRLMADGWFVPSMPDMNQRNPFLANYLIQNSIWWIEYVHLAGIRMDTYPYPDKYMMAEWNRRVLEEYPRFTIVGEEWSLNPAIVSYWQKGQSNPDGYDGYLPSLMDFPLQSALARGLTEEEGWGSGLILLYEALANDFLYPEPARLVVFPDNHDMARFFMQLGMDTGLYRLGITYILTTRGIPQIFYGSEVLMTHTEGNDHGHIRKDFPGGWPGDKVSARTGVGLTTGQAEMQEFFKILLNWRKATPVMHTGKMTHFSPQNGVYVYFRHDDHRKVMVVLNKNRNRQQLDLERFAELTGESPGAWDILTGKHYELGSTLSVPALTPLVLELE